MEGVRAACVRWRGCTSDSPTGREGLSGWLWPDRARGVEIDEHPAIVMHQPAQEQTDSRRPIRIVGTDPIEPPSKVIITLRPLRSFAGPNVDAPD